MAGSPEEDIVAANNILSMAAKGHFFSQNWGGVPATDEDIIKLAKEDHAHHIAHHN